MSAISDVIAYIETQLNGITANTVNALGHTYNFTPAEVIRGRTLTDSSDMRAARPVYAVRRVSRVVDNRDPTFSTAVYTVEIEIQGAVLISDYADPAENAEKCIADIESAIHAAAKPRAGNTLGGNCQSCIYDNDEIITPDPDDQAVKFTVTFEVRLQAKRGLLYS